MTRREQIMQYLLGRIRRVLPDTARSEVMPARVPAEGWTNLMDGDLGDPETTLSPLRYHFEIRPELHIFAHDGVAQTRIDTIEAVLSRLDGLLPDPTLGGLADHARLAPITVEELPVEEAAPLRVAVVPILVFYATTNPLG